MEPKFKPSTEYEYYREIPYEDATPAESLFITSNCSNTSFSSSFLANILDLCLKKYISLELLEKKTLFSEGVIKIIFNEKDDKDLKQDEKITLDFLKEVPELVIWEKYLVFATAFGISEKVLKVVYPQIDDMNSSIYSTCTYIHIMNSVNIGSCVNSSIYSAVGSSGSGYGGGFSGGGGGGGR